MFYLVRKVNSRSEAATEFESGPARGAGAAPAGGRGPNVPPSWLAALEKSWGLARRSERAK